MCFMGRKKEERFIDEYSTKCCFFGISMVFCAVVLEVARGLGRLGGISVALSPEQHMPAQTGLVTMSDLTWRGVGTEQVYASMRVQG